MSCLFRRKNRNKNVDSEYYVIARYYDRKDKEIIYSILTNEKKSVLESLDNAIDSLNVKKKILEKNIKDNETIIKSKNKLECSICMSNTINSVIIPCGHTFCNECIQSEENSNCYICRRKILHVNNLFIT